MRGTAGGDIVCFRGSRWPLSLQEQEPLFLSPFQGHILAHASRLVDVWVDSDNVIIEQGLTNLPFLLHDLVTETLAPLGPQTEAVVVPQIRQTIGQVDPKSDDMSQSIPQAVRFEKGI